MPVVKAQAETTIYLSDERNGRRVRAAAFPNYLCLEWFDNMLFHDLIIKWRNVYRDHPKEGSCWLSGERSPDFH